jgi:hypothetical protein
MQLNQATATSSAGGMDAVVQCDTSAGGAVGFAEQEEQERVDADNRDEKRIREWNEANPKQQVSSTSQIDNLLVKNDDSNDYNSRHEKTVGTKVAIYDEYYEKGYDPKKASEVAAQKADVLASKAGAFASKETNREIMRNLATQMQVVQSKRAVELRSGGFVTPGTAQAVKDLNIECQFVRGGLLGLVARRRHGASMTISSSLFGCEEDCGPTFSKVVNLYAGAPRLLHITLPLPPH